MTRILFFVIGVVYVGALAPTWILLTCPLAIAQELDETSASEVYMVKGELVTIKAAGATRLSLTHPEVADIVKASDKEILMAGQNAGQTALFIWEGKAKRTVMIYVFSQNLELVQERMERLFEAADIDEIKLEIDEQEGKVVASGYIPHHKKERFDQIVEKFSQDVLDLVKEEEIDDLIQIAIQITELNTTLSKSLGIDWFTGTQSVSNNQLTTTSSGGFTPTYGEIMPSLDGSVGDYFKIGQFQRSVNSALIAKINALLEQGKARILSQPKLVVKNGEEASFLVGGEIPIRTTTSTQAGGTQENVQFKEYGISMTITPEIKKEKIDITLNVEVSDVDASNAVGDDVAFTTRSAQTKLYLDNGQTIVLAGLIKQNRSVSLKKVPFLGDVPIVGLLFRSKSTPTADQDQELVITLTPTILQKNRSGDGLKAGAANEPFLDKFEEVVSGEEAPVTATRAAIREEPPDVHKEISDYVASVQQRIAQAIIYPQEAEENGWEGTVKLTLLILKDGTLATALVRESSGHEIFDDYTLGTAKKLAPYSSFPSSLNLPELNVTIPIVYSLKKN